MAFGDDPLLGAQRALIGRPTLRRQLGALPDSSAQTLVDNLSRMYDPYRDKEMYRRSLQTAIDTTNAVAPLAQRDKVNTLLRDPRLSGDQRDALNAQLRTLPDPNSVAGRFDPRNPNSVAYRQFGTLYRDV